MWGPEECSVRWRPATTMGYVAHAGVKEEFWSKIIGSDVGQIVMVYADDSRPALWDLLPPALGLLRILILALIFFRALRFQVQAFLLDQLTDVLLHAAGAYLLPVVHLQCGASVLRFN